MMKRFFWVIWVRLFYTWVFWDSAFCPIAGIFNFENNDDYNLIGCTGQQNSLQLYK